MYYFKNKKRKDKQKERRSFVPQQSVYFISFKENMDSFNPEKIKEIHGLRSTCNYGTFFI